MCRFGFRFRFAHALQTVAVSAATGDGMDKLFEAIKAAREEYIRDFKPEIDRRRRDIKEQAKARADKDRERLKRDLQEDLGMKTVVDAKQSDDSGDEQ